jgi:uroporphyrinogen-III decarboxylase
MFDINKRYTERIEAARERFAAAWRGENKKRPVFVLMDVNAALCGYDDAPENYFEPAAMFDYQAAKIDRHMREIHDDYIPVFHPWYSTAVLPSALGVKVRFIKGMDPAAESTVIDEPSDVKKLEFPDFEKDGLMPKVLETIDYFRANTDAAVAVTDTQGPLNIALTLTGLSKFFVWMYEYPETVHELMDFSAQALIEWVKVQKKRAGHKTEGDAFPHCMYLPEGCGGISFSDDDIVAMSAEHYKEFIMPYNEKVLNAFGGGTVHFCGSARHQVENLSKLKHCTGINNYMMDDFEQGAMLREAFIGKGAVMACDFNSLDIAAQCGNFMRLMENPVGFIANIYVAPKTGLTDGKYVITDKKRDEIVAEYMERLRPWMGE